MKRDDHMRKFEWKKKNRQRSHMCGNKGYTLVELIVTFALLAIFMTAVVACLPNITKIYTNLQAINHQKTICNTVSNQIRNELQSTLGVEGADDALGVKNVNGKGYIALIDDSGQQIMIPTGGAVSTGGAILPASDLTGNTIEFVLRDGIIAQLDAKGFNGYTMRKKKLQVDYHDSKAISSGALLTRYYQTDGDYNKKLTVIDYKSGDYAIATEAGIVTEGLKNVAYAIEYPYAKPFYEGYELKTKFTIKKDAFYSYGDGTTESPKRTYVNYINYTLSLWKDGHMKYSQDYVVNVQNAVPYLGTKAAVDPVVPESDGMYVVKVEENGANWGSGGNYQLHFKIPKIDDAYEYDLWTIQLPERLTTAVYYVNKPDIFYRGDLFLSSNSGSAIKIWLNQTGYTVGERFGDKGFIEFALDFGVSNGHLTVEEMEALIGSTKVTLCKTYEYATRDQANTTFNANNGDGTWVVSYSLTEPTGKKRLRERFDIIYNSNVKEVKTDHPERVTTIIDESNPQIVHVYGAMLEPGESYTNSIRASFEDSSALDNMSEPQIIFAR